ncbi:MAG: DUF4363 family protein [Clostridiales bacterium]|nr:DUF4363 family protein [Clostridiales bacterium]
MKNVVVSFILLFIMIIGITFSLRYLNRVSDDLGKLNDEIEQYITDNNWNEAYKSSLEYTEKWRNYSKIIKLFIDHQEIDNIEMELWKLPQYIKEMTKDESLACVHVLKFLVNHISDLEKVNFQNIF